MTPLPLWRTFSALSRQPRPWICRECLRIPNAQVTQPRAFTTTQHFRSQAGKRTWRKAFKDTAERRKVAITVTLVFVAGSTALAFSERARHGYLAAQRSGRTRIQTIRGSWQRVLDSNGIDRDEVSAALSRIFNEMIFGRDAPLHCDPHGGNLAIRLNPARAAPRNFDIVLYDHGLYRDIPLHLRRAYAHIWLAVLDVDEANMRKYAYEIAGLNDDEFPIFASAITGRDFRVVKSEAGVVQSRSEGEKRAIGEALGEGGLLSQVVFLLAKVPTVILLILKTNDLTRSLDEKLQTREGPVRTFMILAQYAARSVFEESVEGIRGSLLWPGNLWVYGVALASYAKVAVKLRVYELYLSGRRRLGWRAEVMPAAA
ncbi:hypothetical protein LTR12_013337 [Friedmanniomyces endolithicus]|nr:hypothetical protein LTR12_013337 [Friedmanniomyces endolithicus]